MCTILRDYGYRGYHNIRSTCDVVLFEEAKVALFVELDRHEGTSITNRSEQIAGQVFRELYHHWDEVPQHPQEILWLEVYPGSPFSSGPDQIQYTWKKKMVGWTASHPTWGPYGWKSLCKRVGCDELLEETEYFLEILPDKIGGTDG